MFQVICKHCHKEFEAKEQTRFFCSQSCAATHLNINRARKAVKKCLYCEKILSRNIKVYCNNSCQQAERRKNKLNSGLENCSSKFIRTFMIEKFGAKCMKCGWCEINQITKKVPVELNHIDGNSVNNDLSNLEILCPNCHSLTPNFRNLNKGNGRQKRRDRYRNGQSY
jgi:hypothetical protein